MVIQYFTAESPKKETIERLQKAKPEISTEIDRLKEIQEAAAAIYGFDTKTRKYKNVPNKRQILKRKLEKRYKFVAPSQSRSDDSLSAGSTVTSTTSSTPGSPFSTESDSRSSTPSQTNETEDSDVEERACKRAKLC